MLSRIIVELHEDYDNPEDARQAVEQALAPNGVHSVTLEDEDTIAVIIDSLRDAEQEVTDALDAAGIEAYVYTEGATRNKAVENYWANHYINNNLCSLCGNSGVIDTTATAVSAAGVRSGRKNYCICPNGQISRALKRPL